MTARGYPIGLTSWRNWLGCPILVTDHATGMLKRLDARQANWILVMPSLNYTSLDRSKI